MLTKAHQRNQRLLSLLKLSSHACQCFSSGVLPSYLLIKNVHAVIILKFVLHVPPIFLGFITSITFMVEYEIRSSAISFPFILSSFFLFGPCILDFSLFSRPIKYVLSLTFVSKTSNSYVIKLNFSPNSFTTFVSPKQLLTLFSLT